MEMKDVTPHTPLAHERNSILKSKQHTLYDLRGPDKYFSIAQSCSTGRHFSAATQALTTTCSK